MNSHNPSNLTDDEASSVQIKPVAVPNCPQSYYYGHWIVAGYLSIFLLIKDSVYLVVAEG